MNATSLRKQLKSLTVMVTISCFLATSITAQAKILDDMNDFFKDVAGVPAALVNDTIGEAKGINEELKKQFGEGSGFADELKDMGARGGTAMRGQTYTTYMGGSMYQKMPVKNLQLMSVEAPHISAGCGGIDLYMGSISHLDGKKLVAFMKSVVMNMKGVIFQLGLQTISPQVDAVMKWAKKVADEINNLNINSCNMAKGLVAGAGNALTMVNNNACLDAQKTVNSKNHTEAQEECQDSKNQDTILKNTRDNAETAPLLTFKGNMTWEALKLAMCGGKACDADTQEERELIMSMLGSWIYRGNGEGRTVASTVKEDGTPNEAPPPVVGAGEQPPNETQSTDGDVSASANQKSSVSPAEPLFPTVLTVRDLLHGNAAPSGSGTPDATKVHVLLWTCGTAAEDVDKCLNPVKKPVALESYVEKVREMWTRIADKMKAREALNTPEFNFINQTRLPVYQMAELGTRNLNSGMDKDLIDRYKEVVAVDYVMALLNRNVRAGQQALSNKFKWTPAQQDDLKSILASADELMKAARIEERAANERHGDMHRVAKEMKELAAELVKHTPRHVMDKMGG